MEPRVPTQVEIRYPHLIAWRGGETVVMDATTVSDHSDLMTVHDLKVKSYNMPEIRSWVQNHTGCSDSDICFSAIALNWYGAISPESFSDLKRFGLSVGDIELLSVCVLV